MNRGLRRSACASLPLLGLLLSACAARYVEEPELRSRLGDPEAAGLPSGGQDPELDPEAAGSSPAMARALAALFAHPDAPQRFRLCEADPETGDCDDADDGLTAIGLGGAALPLYMDVDALSVSQVEREGEGWTFESRFDSRVNGIPPLCTDATAELQVNDVGSANIEYGGFYCNWILIGNVVTRLKLSIDRIDLPSQSFGGYYALSFNGTGNAVGQGYFRATPSTDEAEKSGDTSS